MIKERSTQFKYVERYRRLYKGCPTSMVYLDLVTKTDEKEGSIDKWVWRKWSKYLAVYSRLLWANDAC